MQIGTLGRLGWGCVGGVGALAGDGVGVGSGLVGDGVGWGGGWYGIGDDLGSSISHNHLAHGNIFSFNSFIKYFTSHFLLASFYNAVFWSILSM